MPRYIDITGQRFGRLTVIAYAGKPGNDRHSHWLCRCDCGTERTIDKNGLISGRSRSCGCLQRETTGKRVLKHGEAGKTPEYSVWTSMLQRCHDQNSKSYKNYGGRGIAVCEHWHDYNKFISDMGRRPTPKHTIERIDNNAWYSPENCRWATRGEQRRNTRHIHLLTFNGQTHCIADWATLTGLQLQTILKRLTHGWSVEDTLTRPLTKGRPTGPDSRLWKLSQNADKRTNNLPDQELD